MQAFFYRHLVPARQLVASVTAGRRPTPPVSVIPAGSVSVIPAGTIAVPAGGTAEVRIQTAAGPLLEKVHLTLNDPPAGLSLAEVRPEADGMTLILSADGNVLEPGYTDNLIVAADMAAEDAPGRGAGTKKKGRVALGVLPPIPIEVVAQ